MKNPFLTLNLILAVGIPSTIAAATVGVFPATLDVMPAFVGLFAVIGVMAINAADYTERSSLRPPKLTATSRPATTVARAVVAPSCVCAEAA